jgi:hypothetical protein
LTSRTTSDSVPAAGTTTENEAVPVAPWRRLLDFDVDGTAPSELLPPPWQPPKTRQRKGSRSGPFTRTRSTLARTSQLD